jgi:hypothetical protein
MEEQLSFDVPGEASPTPEFLTIAEAAPRADLAAELDRLVLGEVAQVLDLDLSVRIFGHRERVDHAHRVALTQALVLGDDLAVELRMLEAEHNHCTGPMAIALPSGHAATAVEVAANLTPGLPARTVRMGWRTSRMDERRRASAPALI